MPKQSLPQAKAGVDIHAFSKSCQMRGQWATEHAREDFAHQDKEKLMRVGQTLRYQADEAG
jgi:hypothetical protein